MSWQAYRIIEYADVQVEEVNPSTLEPTGTMRDPTPQELADRYDLLHQADVPAGTDVRLADLSTWTTPGPSFVALALAADRRRFEAHPGRLLARGYLNERNERLDTTLKRKVWRAHVWRDVEAGGLRSRVSSDHPGPPIPEFTPLDPWEQRPEAPPVPRQGQGQPGPPSGLDVDAVLADLRDRATPAGPDGPTPPVRRLTVRMEEIDAEDIVERDAEYPRIQGEITSR